FMEGIGVFPLPTFVPLIDFPPTLYAFEQIFGIYRFQFFNAVKNSAIASLLGATIATFVGALASYGLTRFRFEKRFVTNDEIAFFFISQRMLPPVAVVFPFLLMYSYAGMIDRAWALGLAYVLFNL